jgi:hypothetical protein
MDPHLRSLLPTRPGLRHRSRSPGARGIGLPLPTPRRPRGTAPPTAGGGAGGAVVAPRPLPAHPPPPRTSPTRPGFGVCRSGPGTPPATPQPRGPRGRPAGDRREDPRGRPAGDRREDPRGRPARDRCERAVRSARSHRRVELHADFPVATPAHRPPSRRGGWSPGLKAVPLAPRASLASGLPASVVRGCSVRAAPLVGRLVAAGNGSPGGSWSSAARSHPGTSISFSTKRRVGARSRRSILTLGIN